MAKLIPFWKSFHFIGCLTFILLVVTGGLLRQPPSYALLGLSGLLLLVSRDLNAREVETDGVLPGRMGWAALAAFLLFALGAWIGSNAIEMWAVSLLGGLWIWSIYGGARALPLLLLLGLICLPKGILEETLLLRMQRSAAGLASWALDTQRIPHVPKGAVIETANGALFVEEACSGMMSLLTGLIVTQIYFAWQRMGLRMSLVGLALSSVLLFTGNCLRIVLVAVAYAKWRIDWTSGWRHEIAGLLVYMLVLSLLPGLRQLLLTVRDGFLLWLYPWIEHDPPFRPMESRKHPALSGYKEWIGALIRRFPPGPARARAGMMAVTLMTMGLADAPANNVHPSDWPSLRETELVRNVNGWSLDPAGREVSFLKTFGLNHQVWQYRKGTRKAWISADLPFESVHTLPNCYSMRDWSILQNEPIAPPDTAPLNVMELKSQGEGGSLLVLFSNYDLTRHKHASALPTRLEGRWGQVMSRLGIRPEERSIRPGPFCQIQLVLEGGDAMESEAGRDVLELFKEVRRDLVEKLHLESASAGKGDR